MAKKAAHHGGAWKVAYADFVTAMMALFMVLWISSQDKKILIATSHYFQHPFAYQTQGGGGIAPIKKTDADAGGNGGNGGEDSTSQGKPGIDASRQAELNILNSIASDLTKKLQGIDQDAQQRPMDIQVTSDGLKLTLFDRARQPLFEGDSATFTQWGRFVMQSLAWIIDQRHFDVMIDGHTHAGVKTRADGTGPWELSTDQAGAARRCLVLYGVDASAIDRVAGYADTEPLPGEKPEAQANQRLTISLSLAHRRSGPSDGDTPDSGNPPPSPEAQ